MTTLAIREDRRDQVSRSAGPTTARSDRLPTLLCVLRLPRRGLSRNRPAKVATSTAKGPEAMGTSLPVPIEPRPDCRFLHVGAAPRKSSCRSGRERRATLPSSPQPGRQAIHATKARAPDKLTSVATIDRRNFGDGSLPACAGCGAGSYWSFRRLDLDGG